MTIPLVLVLASGAWAQRVFPIIELTDETVQLIDIHDGSVGDWLDVIGEPTVTALDFETHPDYGPYNPASLDFRIWLAWHDATDRIFVAMERADDIYINEYPVNGYIFEYDSYIVFSVDGDHSGGSRSGHEQHTANMFLAIAEVLSDESPQLGYPGMGVVQALLR